jgi:hypothetical protein
MFKNCYFVNDNDTVRPTYKYSKIHAKLTAAGIFFESTSINFLLI